ncbi:hypothetical protein GCM10010302_42440 [Streptomyces polychromogenes]|uniref:STAS domain-containing protein n=1 Tax=Streptomyces polychromogenes TaxID=67342 RepID=A0ABN0VGI2_9ACTN
MRSYTVQVRLYGSVAVVTLCALPDPSHPFRHAAAGDALASALTRLGAGVDSVVLDLDCAPDPALGEASASVDAWAAGREVTVVILAPAPGPTPGPGSGRGGPPGVPVLRTGPANDSLAGAGNEAAPVRRLRRAVAGRTPVPDRCGLRCHGMTGRQGLRARRRPGGRTVPRAVARRGCQDTRSRVVTADIGLGPNGDTDNNTA